jgi:hypothetical protein
MRNSEIVICIAIVFANGLFSQEGAVGVHQYDVMETLRIRRPTAKELAMARSFVWEHWKNRQRGIVAVETLNIEGEKSTTTYFVEPAEGNLWHVRLHRDRILVSRGGLIKAPEFVSEDFEAIELELSTDGNTLSMKNREGVIVGSL